MTELGGRGRWSNRTEFIKGTVRISVQGAEEAAAPPAGQSSGFIRTGSVTDQDPALTAPTPPHSPTQHTHTHRNRCEDVFDCSSIIYSLSN